MRGRVQLIVLDAEECAQLARGEPVDLTLRIEADDRVRPPDPPEARELIFSKNRPRRRRKL
jgi:hypothetical protein